MLIVNKPSRGKTEFPSLFPWSGMIEIHIEMTAFNTDGNFATDILLDFQIYEDSNCNVAYGMASIVNLEQPTSFDNDLKTPPEYTSTNDLV